MCNRRMEELMFKEDYFSIITQTTLYPISKFTHYTLNQNLKYSKIDLLITHSLVNYKYFCKEFIQN